MELITLITFLKENSTLSLIITFLFSFSAWLYKENRELISVENNEKLRELEKGLEEFCMIESKIAFYLQFSEINNEIFLDLGKIMPYCRTEIALLISDYYKVPSKEHLYTILEFIKIEIQNIRKTKEKHNPEGSVSDPFIFFKRIFRPLVPAILLNFTIIITFLATIFNRDGEFTYSILNFIAVIFSFCFSIAILYILIKILVVEGLNRVDNKWKIEVFIIILSPVLIFLNKDLGVVSLCIQFATLFFSVLSYRESRIIIYR